MIEVMIEVLDIQIQRFDRKRFELDMSLWREAGSPRITYSKDKMYVPEKFILCPLEKSYNYYFYSTTSKETIYDKIDDTNPLLYNNRILFIDNDVLYFDSYKLYSFREMRERDREISKQMVIENYKISHHFNFSDHEYDSIWKMLDRNDKIKELLD